jgi:large subunit ribosomal protein L29
MALPKIEDVRNLNDEDLSTEILNVKRELFRLRLEKATRQLKSPHLFKHKKTSSSSTAYRRKRKTIEKNDE